MNNKFGPFVNIYSSRNDSKSDNKYLYFDAKNQYAITIEETRIFGDNVSLADAVQNRIYYGYVPNKKEYGFFSIDYLTGIESLKKKYEAGLIQSVKDQIRNNTDY
jgi:hypothetical protein